MMRALAAVAAAVVGLGTTSQAQAPKPAPNPVVVFETGKGTIEVEVDAVHAPGTAANFLRYVDAKFFDGGLINRAVRPDNTVRHDIEIQVIQFQTDAAREKPEFPPIPLERTSVTGARSSSRRAEPSSSTRSASSTALFNRRCCAFSRTARSSASAARRPCP